MRPGTARGKPIASNCSHDIVPLVSVRSTWSIAMPISSPASPCAAHRGVSLEELAREALPHGSSLVDRDPGAAAGADVVAAGPDQPVVVVLLDDVRRPARDAPGGDDRREEVDRDAERVEERRRVEVDVGDELLRLVHAGMELHRHLVPLELAGLAAGLLGHAL